jgi:hypothetical protein
MFDHEIEGEGGGGGGGWWWWGGYNKRPSRQIRRIKHIFFLLDFGLSRLTSLQFIQYHVAEFFYII